MPTACLKKHLFRLIDNLLNKVGPYIKTNLLFFSLIGVKKNLFFNISSEDFVCLFIYFIYIFYFIFLISFPRNAAGRALM